MKTRLRYWRRMKGMTQMELVAATGVSNQTIVAIEKHGQEPRVTTLRKLARALNVSTEDLFTDNPAYADGQDDEEKPAAKPAA